MAKEEMDRPGERTGKERELLGWLKEFFYQFELAWKLLWDGRVPLFTKLVPLLMLVYLLLPLDILPDALVGLGQVDDVVVLLVGLRMFISLCPPSVVAEYDRLQTKDVVTDDWELDEAEIIDLKPEEPDETDNQTT